MTEFSTTATEILYLNLRTVERKDPQITKRNWLLNLDFSHRLGLWLKLPLKTIIN
jgi:hypothetical protein